MMNVREVHGSVFLKAKEIMNTVGRIVSIVIKQKEAIYVQELTL